MLVVLISSTKETHDSIRSICEVPQLENNLTFS